MGFTIDLTGPLSHMSTRLIQASRKISVKSRISVLLKRHKAKRKLKVDDKYGVTM